MYSVCVAHINILKKKPSLHPGCCYILDVRNSQFERKKTLQLLNFILPEEGWTDNQMRYSWAVEEETNCNFLLLNTTPIVNLHV